MIKTPVGFVSAGGFRRLPMHVGAKYSYFSAEEKGYVPHPFFMGGSSAGAISDAACLPWTDRNFQKVARTILDLRQKDMFTFPTEVKLVAGLSIAESFLGFIHVLCPDLSREVKFGIESGRTLLSLGAKAAPLYELFLRQTSLYSNAPLRRLLKDPGKGLDFPNIWNSDIRLEIPAVNILTGKEYIFSLDDNWFHPDRDGRLISALLASSSLPAHFPLEKLDDQLLDDAAILNSIPIHRAIAAGCQTIFVFLYSNNGGISVMENWVDELSRALDISMGEIIKHNLAWHVNVNQYQQKVKQTQRKVAELEEAIYQLDQLVVVPEQEGIRGFLNEEIRQKLDQLKAGLGEYPCVKENTVTIIPVMSDAPMPEQYFRKFNKELMLQAMEIGFEAMTQTLRIHAH
jgi:hypothetical protein